MSLNRKHLVQSMSRPRTEAATSWWVIFRDWTNGYGFVCMRQYRMRSCNWWPNKWNESISWMFAFKHIPLAGWPDTTFKAMHDKYAEIFTPQCMSVIFLLYRYRMQSIKSKLWYLLTKPSLWWNPFVPIVNKYFRIHPTCVRVYLRTSICCDIVGKLYNHFIWIGNVLRIEKHFIVMVKRF